MIRSTMAAGALAMLATLTASLPAVGAESRASLSLRNSFRIGNAGVLCTAQSRALSPNLVGMFDRGYSIVCRDAASAVGTLHALRKGADDPLARIAKNRGADVKCDAPKPVTIEGIGALSASDCVDQTNQLAYKFYSAQRGNVVFTAEGLGGYDSALQLGLRTLMA
ncbi:MAG: hypothetical protein JWR77_116, partial [Rhizorhabdus sp.]|nr:hypothetical protein [Rhizorhabdus sp.]